MKIEALNGVRGFAVLLVLFSHASNYGLIVPNFSFSGAGRYGVFLFFTLSAFLLTSQFFMIVHKRNSFKKWLKIYFEKRFLRIYPLFLVTLLTYFVLDIFGIGIYQFSLELLLRTLVFADSVGVFWTIPVEFEYYFILPFVAYVLQKLNSLKLNSFVVVLVTVIWWEYFPKEYSFTLLPFFPIFLMGSFTAFVSQKLFEYSLSKREISLLNIMAIISVFSFFCLIPNFYNHLAGSNFDYTAFHNDFLKLTSLSCLLLISVIHGDGLIKLIMQSKILVFWGNVSFSAYLGHMLILNMVVKFAFGPIFSLCIFFVFTAICSFISFKFIEIPFSKRENIKNMFAKFERKNTDFVN